MCSLCYPEDFFSGLHKAMGGHASRGSIPAGAFACTWIIGKLFSGRYKDDTGGFTKRGECVATCMFLFETLSPTAKKEMVPLWDVVSRNLTLSRNPHWVRTERLLPFGLSCSNVRNATAISIATHIPLSYDLHRSCNLWSCSMSAV